MAAERDPYLGPRPFEREDADRFYGRRREIRDVVSLVVAQRVLLLYSASGAGKSSLLNAGVLPVLERQKGFDVLPVGRVRADAPPPAHRNVFAFGLLCSLDEEAAAESGAGLAEALAQRPRRPGTRLRALVIDQFEELFTAHPERWPDRPALFKALAAALERDPALRLVLAVREDFLAQLDPFAALLPGGLRTRFRLERLDRASALAAVERPLEPTGRSFAPGVAEEFVADLLRFRVDTGRGGVEEVEAEYVEPVQLQVAGRSLWSDLPPEVTVITSEHLRTHGDVDQVLTRFYDDAVAAAAGGKRRVERRIREWVGKTLITPGGTRGAAYAAESETAGLPNPLVEVLEQRRLIRAEWRANARWYELTHDRLIEPIRRSNERRASAIRARWLKTAASTFGAVAGVLGTIAGLALVVFPSLRPEAAPEAATRSVVISALQLETNVTRGAFLRGQGSATTGFSPAQLAEVGQRVVFTARLERFKDTTIDFRGRLIYTTRGEPVTGPSIAISLTPQSDVQESQLRLWLEGAPVEQAFNAEVAAFHGGATLAQVRSLSFTLTRDGDTCTIVGTSGDDALFGSSRPDVICGLAGADRLHGGPGGDVVAGGTGSDVLAGGAGDDALDARDGRPDDVDGGPGADSASVDRGRDQVRSVELVR